MAGVLASTQTITSVNSTYVLSVPIMGLSFALQQYSAGRAFDIEDYNDGYYEEDGQDEEYI